MGPAQKPRTGLAGMVSSSKVQRRQKKMLGLNRRIIYLNLRYTLPTLLSLAWDGIEFEAILIFLKEWGEIELNN